MLAFSDDATGLFDQGWGSGCCLYMQASCFGTCAPEMLDSDEVGLLSFATS